MKSMCVALAMVMGGMVGLLSAATASAQDGGTYKIGVVDLQEVLAGYNKRKAKYDQLEQEVKARQVKIDALSNEIEADKKNYEGMRTSNPEGARELETEIQKKFTEYKAQMQILQQEIDSMEEKVLREVIGDVEAQLNQIGQSENYHLILNSRKGPNSSVVYHSTTIDITAKVLTALNGGKN